ncbi:MAG: hypothetical protein KKA73_30165 [Chloroflexi bacterium]|nr:hypothetical protein [Chloroflexota bacterium]MBU1751965.1 hypothetical protein [Chloroflexota bacterium]
MNISWEPPEPRTGLAGAWDRFVGPGATPAELWLLFGTAVTAGIAAPLYAIAANLGWDPLQLVVAGLLALDLAGGVVTNATSTAKRWYHREGQGFAQHLGFVAIHAVQILLVAWLFRGLDWAFFLAMYGYLLAAAIVVLRVPLYLQRPVAVLLYAGALLLNAYAFPPTPGLEWFAPVFFLKLLVSHLLKEAPYRPESEGRPEHAV